MDFDIYYWLKKISKYIIEYSQVVGVALLLITFTYLFTAIVAEIGMIDALFGLLKAMGSTAVIVASIFLIDKGRKK